MKKHANSLLAMVAVLATMLACQTLTSASPTPETSDNVLFQDDFSNTSSGWDRVDTNEGKTDYENGVYRIYVNTSGTDVWANPGLSFTEARVEVEASKVGGPDDNDFGVICRYKDTEHFYFAIISSDGYYGIGKVSGGEQILIGSESMETSSAINQGNSTNRLRMDCVGDRISLYVNGNQVNSVQDNELVSGDVGLIAGTFSEAGTDIHFDNFKVLKP